MSNDLVPKDDWVEETQPTPSNLLPAVPGEGATPLVTKRPKGSSNNVEYPKLKLLQKMSQAIDDGIPGAKPGLFLHDASNTIIEGPFTVLVTHYHEWNLFRPKDADDGEKCYSHDLVNGSHYGLCEECRRCTEWRKNKSGRRQLPPLGTQFIDLTVLTRYGPAILQCSSRAYRTALKYIDHATMSNRNLWAHPTVLRSAAKVDGKNTNYVLHIDWDATREVEPKLQEMAYATYLEREEYWRNSLKRIEEKRAGEEFDVD